MSWDRKVKKKGGVEGWEGIDKSPTLQVLPTTEKQVGKGDFRKYNVCKGGESHEEINNYR